MSSVFPDFPYSIEDEPSDDWTVEHALQWCVLRAHNETDVKYNEMADTLSKQLEKGKEEIWECHKQVVATVLPSGQEANENSDPQRPHEETHSALRTSGTGMEKTIKASSTSLTTIHIEIMTGEHKGKIYDLQPKHRAPCWIGRSQGKKFRERGISLPKDLEVSTTHGKFELLQGHRFCFTDTESTNGSFIGDKALVPDEPIELKNGMEIIVGQSVLKITLL